MRKSTGRRCFCSAILRSYVACTPVVAWLHEENPLSTICFVEKLSQLLFTNPVFPQLHCSSPAPVRFIALATRSHYVQSVRFRTHVFCQPAIMLHCTPYIYPFSYLRRPSVRVCISLRYTASQTNGCPVIQAQEHIHIQPATCISIHQRHIYFPRFSALPYALHSHSTI